MCGLGMFKQCKVVIDHQCCELLEGSFVFPSKFSFGERSVPEEVLWFGGAMESGIETVVVFPVQPDVLEGELDKFLDAV